MVNITLSVPEELKKKMDEFPEMNWSAVAREAIWEKATQLSLLKSISSRSRLTEKDAMELGKKINKAVSKHYKEML